MKVVFNCALNSWSPTLGDPTFMGWLTVALYLIAAILSAMVTRQTGGKERLFWTLTTILLVLLTVNKQLDLQSAFTAIGRCAAKLQGWYEGRQTIQIYFIISVGLISICACIVLAWMMRTVLGKIWLALLGLVAILAFVTIRAAGFHGFDRFINFEVGVLAVNWMLEIGAILLITTNAILRRRKIAAQD